MVVIGRVPTGNTSFVFICFVAGIDTSTLVHVASSVWLWHHCMFLVMVSDANLCLQIPRPVSTLPTVVFAETFKMVPCIEASRFRILDSRRGRGMFYFLIVRPRC